MEYTELTPDEQIQILAQRRKQYEAEHFNHATNRELLVASGLDDETTRRAIEEADHALATLDKAHAGTSAKLAKLKAAKKK